MRKNWASKMDGLHAGITISFRQVHKAEEETEGKGNILLGTEKIFML